MVCDNTYQEARTEIEESVTSCMDSLIEQTKNRQGRATSIFSDMYRKLEVSIVLQVILTLVLSGESGDTETDPPSGGA